MRVYLHLCDVPPHDIYQAHRDVMARYPRVDSTDPRHELGILHCAADGLAMVQSTTEPDCRSTPVNLDLGDEVRFRVVAQPSKRSRRSGRVTALAEPEWGSWLVHKLALAGMTSEVEVLGSTILRGRKGEHWIEHLGVRFAGHARVTDRGLATQAIVSGIGRGKAFGLGMLRVEGIHAGL